MDVDNVLTIIHFNDVYNIEPNKEEPVAGAVRFVSAVKSFSHLNPIVLFSGDIFSPSILSLFTEGEHMSKVLNELSTQCAVFGNHDFDFGLEVLKKRVSECNFPWLMSNVTYNKTGRPLGEGKISHVLIWNDKKIGLIGLVEYEWLETLDTVDIDEVTFLDYSEVGRKLSIQLKDEGCDYIIALTHMRNHNDIKLAETVDEIDIILGGHDHVYEINKINDTYIIKSGTDFRQFSKISVDFSNTKPEISIEEINVTSIYEPDAAMAAGLKVYNNILEGKLHEELGHFDVELDGRFSTIRTQETNMGSWICDVLLKITQADLVILNSGTFRSDKIHPPGSFTYNDLLSVIPAKTLTVVIEVSGEQILGALENSVCKYPALEGRFAQVAGINFCFDPKANPGQRVDPRLVRIGEKYLALEKKYKLGTAHYMFVGRDGYTVLKNSRVLVDHENSPELTLALQNYFQSIKMKNCHGKKIVTHDNLPGLSSDESCSDLSQTSFDKYFLSPNLENRIVILNLDNQKELLSESQLLEFDNQSA